MSRRPRLPGYELTDALGGGPMTCVYAGRELATDAAAAVKLPRPTWPDAAAARVLIAREAHAGLAVRNPHLVRVRAAALDRDPPFLVMDLLPGESLRDRLRRDYRLDVPTALWICRQTATGLAALHRHGFVH